MLNPFDLNKDLKVGISPYQYDRFDIFLGQLNRFYPIKNNVNNWAHYIHEVFSLWFRPGVENAKKVHLYVFIINREHQHPVRDLESK